MRRLVIGVLLVIALAALAGVVHWAQPLLASSVAPGWRGLDEYPLEHADAIRDAARRNGLDPALVAAVIYAESRFDEHARSSQGAVGLMQVLPGTAAEIARETGGAAFVAADLEDPRINVRYGCYFLRRALDNAHGDVLAAVAAYNAGMGAVGAWEAQARAAGHELRLADIPFAETRAYVERVLELRGAYRAAYGDRLLGQPAPV